MKTDVVVIGGGPGGYVAAIRLSQLGKKVILIEKEKMGGTCLQVGCIPSKALIRVGKLLEEIENCSKLGIEISGDINVNLPKLLEWKENTTKLLTKGVEGLCKANQVQILKGQAKFSGSHSVIVKNDGKEETIEFDHCIIATGSIPFEIPGFSFDGKKILNSSHALSLKEIPNQLAVIGGGYIGLELGSFYAKLGTQVTVIEMMPQLLPGFDLDAVKVIERKLRKDKVEILLETKAINYKEQNGKVKLKVDRKGESIEIETDFILVTVGRKPYCKDLEIEKAGLKTNEKGFIPVNQSLQTHVSHIYAIGDIAKDPMLAHKASKEGEVAAEHICGKESTFDSQAIPAVVFTDPEMASVGLIEREAKDQGMEILIGKFPMSASSKAMIAGHTEGFVKIIADKNSRTILGVLIVGYEAGTMISEAAILVEMGATLDDLALTIHPHPTLPESVMEAAKAALGEPIHILKK